tara:strand:- start:8 stop:283 length:276 start_codon:yes stop_codon:yes gene_type:complete
MTWKKNLKREIEKNHLDLGIFTLEELYRVSYNNLCMKYPKNNTIEASVRRTLQEIRDEGYLIFLEKGEYKVNNSCNDEYINFVSNYHNNHK